VQLEFVQHARDQLGEAEQIVARGAVRQAEGIGAREGVEKIGVLRDVALEVRRREGAVAQSGHEAMRQDARRPVRVGVPQDPRQ
jgi:hypothetical protein